MNYAFYDLQLGFLFRACGETVKRPQINYWQKLIVHVIAPSVCVCVCLCLPGGLCRTLILFFCRPLCPFRRFICGNSLQTLDFGALVPATANGFQLNSSQRLSNEWIRIFISCVIVVCSASIHRGRIGHGHANGEDNKRTFLIWKLHNIIPKMRSNVPYLPERRRRADIKIIMFWERAGARTSPSEWITQ